MTEADKEVVDELTKLVAGQLVMKGFISFQDGRNRRAEIEEIARSCLSEVRRHDASRLSHAGTACILPA